MTPLEMAKKRQKEMKTKPPCKDCPKSERVEETLYCGVDGKIILPKFEHICCCLGKKLIEGATEMPSELKPCPFCGGKNVVLETYKARKGHEANILCNSGCILYMHTITYDTEEEAVEAVTKAWNRRATDEQSDRN